MKQQPKTVRVPVPVPVPVPGPGPGAERSLACRTAPGLFSADRVDDGTRLLLAHLPSGPPTDVLDLGCGWGAISVAVAAAFPGVRVRAIDRDLLAVRLTAENAAALGLAGVRAEGGIGTRGLPVEPLFDWALCNVPARIGDGGIRLILAGCARRLRSGGELRVVVIRDLTETTTACARGLGLAAAVVVESRNHAIVAVAPAAVEVDEDELAPWIRDEVVVAGRTLARPADLGEDPAHLRAGLPLLLELLPKRADGVRATFVRGGYGAAALELAARSARTTLVERDLLAAAIAGRNAARHGLALDIATAAWLPDAIAGPVELAIVEPSEPMGLAEAVRELTAVRARLSDGGRLVCLARARFAEGLRAGTKASRVLAARDGFAVVEARATRN